MMRTSLLALLVTFAGAALVAEPVKVWTRPMDPREHPDDARRAVKPPDVKALGDRVHFITMRTLGAGRGWEKDLDRYVERDDLGDFLWPDARCVLNPKWPEQVAEIKRRGYWLFDLWGFGNAASFVVPRTTIDLMARELGDHWLGFDNGELDGAYFGAFSRVRNLDAHSRFGCYREFQKFFEQMDERLGNRMATLMSLTYGPYFLRENCYTMIGAETAQHLPNAQVYYAFIRGAGKQCGVPWFGNVSIYNRWGLKRYDCAGASNERPGPTKGTSLALMKKLMYSQIFYNSVAVGFEAGFYDAKGNLSPIGVIQRDANRWCRKLGNPGVMHTPVALVTDFYSGWTFPREPYTRDKYGFRVWGYLPYEPGDYLMDGVLSMLYPGYEDSGYYRDERGFNAPTPYGDIADVLFSDAQPWLLRQYPVVVLANRITPSAEFSDKMTDYLAAGGELVLTEGNLKALFPKGTPNGKVTVVPGAWGIAEKPQCAEPVVVAVEKPLARAYPLTAAARKVLDGVFRRQMIFATSAEPCNDGLSLITCRRGKGDYTVCVVNDTWRERPLNLCARAGRICAVEEVPVPSSERTAVGFAPEGMDVTAGTDAPNRIAAGAVRVFRVKLDEAGEVEALPPTRPEPNATNLLRLREIASIKGEILKRPTFFQHFAGVVVDGEYVLDRDVKGLKREANWTGLQGLEIGVDMTELITGYPRLRFWQTNAVDNAHFDATFDDLFAKMRVLGAKDAFVCTEQTSWRVEKAAYTNIVAHMLRGVCRKAAKDGVRIHMRQVPGDSYCSAISWLETWQRTIAAPNFRSAPSLAGFLLQENRNFDRIVRVIGDLVNARRGNVRADYCFFSAPAEDPLRKSLYTYRAPVASQTLYPDVAPAVEALARTGVRFVFDACHPDDDSLWRDVKMVESAQRLVR